MYDTLPLIVLLFIMVVCFAAATVFYLTESSVKKRREMRHRFRETWFPPNR